MARNTRTFTVSAPGRDHNKRFLITEMPADQAERWAIRALIVLANAGTKLPDDVMDAGMAGMASMASVFVMSLRSLQGLSYDAVGDLLEEMMTCVQFQPPGNVPAQPLFVGDNSQIEEVKTRLLLKWEVLQVHTDFSLADALLSFRTAPAADTAPSA